MDITRMNINGDEYTVGKYAIDYLRKSIGKKEYFTLISNSTAIGKLIGIDGTAQSFSNNVGYKKYKVDSDKYYAVDCGLTEGYSWYLVIYLDSEDNVIGNHTNTLQSYANGFRNWNKEYLDDMPSNCATVVVNSVISVYPIVLYEFSYNFDDYNKTIETVEKLNDVLSTKEIYQTVTPAFQEDGFFRGVKGQDIEFVGHNSMKSNVYDVVPDNEDGTFNQDYYLKGLVSRNNYSYGGVFYANESEILGIEYQMIDNMTLDNVVLNIPVGTNQIFVNNTIWGNTVLERKKDTLIDVEQIKEDVDDLKSKLETSHYKMEVTIDKGTIWVRSRYSDTEDIVLEYLYANKTKNNNITPNRTYTGDKLLSTKDLCVSANVIHDYYDSTGPLFGCKEYWHLFAQHGYLIPVWTVEGYDGAVGNIVADNQDRIYTVGKIEGNQVYLLPELTQTSTLGASRDWKTPSSNNNVTNLINTETSQVYNVTSTSNTQLYPLTKPTNQRLYVDGIEVTDGTYYCNEFIAKEFLNCYDPANIQNWFSDIIYGDVMSNIIESFIFDGYNVTVNTVFRNFKPVAVEQYAGCQGRHFTADDNVNNSVIIPKVKKTITGGIPMDTPFSSKKSDTSALVTVSTNDLYNVADMPDRQLSYKYKNNVKYIGFASGLSLISGESKPTNRRKYFKTGETCLNFSPSNQNKFYVYVMRGSYFNENWVIPEGYMGEFNYYFSYYNPQENNENANVYWVKEGNRYLIYIHGNNTTYSGVKQINVGNDLEGMKLTVLESNNSNSLISDTVIDGTIYINFTSNKANNYITLIAE